MDDRVIARLWECKIDEMRAAEYDTFAHERSLPTFRAHSGFRGAAFLGDGAQRAVLTIWDSMESIELLEQSSLYQDTVDAIMQTGFILSVTPATTAEIE
jgi:heme-degrading monooxygenase HmoA